MPIHPKDRDGILVALGLDLLSDDGHATLREETPDTKTGWPPSELMQDDCRKLSIWFSTRLGAAFLIRTKE